MAKTDIPVISVITPTFNRANELPFLVQSIQNQTLDHSLFEMIIVDDGSTDNTESLVRSLIEKINFNLKYFTKNNQGPGAARNYGIKNSKGELILFIDSDCEADPLWMEIIYDYYTKEGFDACGGPDAAKSDFTPLQKAIDYSMTSFMTTGGMRGHNTKMIAKFYPRSHNMGVTKILIKKVGGFGSLRHGQDIELSYRIRKIGSRVIFIKDAIVYHRRRTTLKKFFRQVFNWGIARINLGKIDSVMLEPIHYLPSIVTLLFFVITIGLTINFKIFSLLFFIGLMGLGFISVYGGIVKESIIVGLFLPLVVTIQLFGYGVGFLSAFVVRFIFNGKVLKGFTKKYY